MHFVFRTVPLFTQRYFCNNCEKIFNFRKKKNLQYAPSFKHKAVKMYIVQSVSLRALSQELTVSKSSIHRWLKELYGKVKTPIEVASQLTPHWGNILLIDAKQMGKKVIMIAVDFATGDVVCHLPCDSENKTNFRKLLVMVKNMLQYTPFGIVSDLGKGKSLPALVREVFPTAHHQICIIHFWRYICMKLPKSKKSAYYHTNQLLKTYIKHLLWAKTKMNALHILDTIISNKEFHKTHYHKSILKSLVKYFDLLTVHHHVHTMPDNTNLIENVNRQLERRLKTTDTFKSDISFATFLNLWFIWFRFQPLYNAINKNYNSLSRLNIANVKTNFDWFSFALSKK